MTKLRKTLKRRYARHLFAGAVDHAARSAYSVRIQPSVRKAVLRLILDTESMFLHWMSAALGVQACDVYWVGHTNAPRMYYGIWLNYFFFDHDEKLIGSNRMVID